MTKQPTLEDRRIARQAELAEAALQAEAAARGDAELNAPVLAELMKDVAALGAVADRLKTAASGLIVTNDAGQIFKGQIDTLIQLQGNLDTLGQALITHGVSIIAATED